MNCPAGMGWSQIGAGGRGRDRHFQSLLSNHCGRCLLGGTTGFDPVSEAAGTRPGARQARGDW